MVEQHEHDNLSQNYTDYFHFQKKNILKIKCIFKVEEVGIENRIQYYKMAFFLHIKLYSTDIKIILAV